MPPLFGRLELRCIKAGSPTFYRCGRLWHRSEIPLPLLFFSQIMFFSRSRPNSPGHEPLLPDDPDVENELKSRTSSRSSINSLTLLVLLANIILLSVNIWSTNGHFFPAKQEKLVQQRWNLVLGDVSPYTAPPSPEVEARWEDISADGPSELIQFNPREDLLIGDCSRSAQCRKRRAQPSEQDFDPSARRPGISSPWRCLSSAALSCKSTGRRLANIPPDRPARTISAWSSTTTHITTWVSTKTPCLTPISVSWPLSDHRQH